MRALNSVIGIFVLLLALTTTSSSAVAIVAPAFRETYSKKSYWYLNEEALNEVMRKAHTKFIAPVTDFEKIEEHLHLDSEGNLINQRILRAPQLPKTVIGGGTPCKKQNLPKR